MLFVKFCNFDCSSVFLYNIHKSCYEVLKMLQYLQRKTETLSIVIQYANDSYPGILALVTMVETAD